MKLPVEIVCVRQQPSVNGHFNVVINEKKNKLLLFYENVIFVMAIYSTVEYCVIK